MSSMKRWLPHPDVSAVLLIVWLLFNHSVSVGHLLFGTVLGVLIPKFTERFFPEPVYIKRGAVLIRFVATVAWDILVASMAVARLTLDPMSRPAPRFVRVPVSLADDFALTALAGTVSLTPGTVSAQLSEDRRHLLVHVLDLDDESGLIHDIKQRYEAPIKEIFRC